jgi:hypothetical protein
MKISMTTLKKAAAMALITVTMFAVSTNSVAQTGNMQREDGKTSLVQAVYGMGTNFSLLSGMGFSLKEHFSHSQFSYMVTGYVWKDHAGATYDFGLEVQYDIYIKDLTRFYVLAGMSQFYNGSRESRWDPTSGQWNLMQETNHLDGPTRLGTGIGFETALSDAVGFYSSLSVTSFQPSGDLQMLPSAGLMVYFK